MSGEAIGKPLRRIDGRAKVTGQARYAAEFNQKGQVYAVIVSATAGLGRIAAIEADEVARIWPEATQLWFAFRNRKGLG